MTGVVEEEEEEEEKTKKKREDARAVAEEKAWLVQLGREQGHTRTTLP